MFPANGPKKPAAVTIPKMNRCRLGESAEYGGLGIGFEFPAGEVAAVPFEGMDFSRRTSTAVLEGIFSSAMAMTKRRSSREIVYRMSFSQRRSKKKQ